MKAEANGGGGAVLRERLINVQAWLCYRSNDVRLAGSRNPTEIAVGSRYQGIVEWLVDNGVDDEGEKKSHCLRE